MKYHKFIYLSVGGVRPYRLPANIEIYQSEEIWRAEAHLSFPGNKERTIVNVEISRPTKSQADKALKKFIVDTYLSP
jgi:hypothetical protein